MSSHGPGDRSITAHAKGCVISLIVTPRSPANRMTIDASGRIRAWITAPPIDGAANAGLIKLLSAVLDTPRGSLSVVAGVKARHKRVLVHGLSPESAWQSLSRAGDRSQP